MGLQNNFCNFDFFGKIFFNHMKELVEYVTEIRVSKLNPRFFKNSWRSKNGPKIAKLFFFFLTTRWKLWFQNWYQMIDTKFQQCEQLSFLRNFATYAFYFKIKFFLANKQLTISFELSTNYNFFLKNIAAKNALFNFEK